MPHARVRSFGHSGYLNIAYTEHGTGSVPVVLYPPFGHSKSIYDDLIKQLGDNIRCVRLDPPGVGDSDTPTVGAYTVNQEADTLRNFLTALGIDKAVIVGVSRGATVALTFAQRYPERTLGVVTQGPVINSDDFPNIEKRLVASLVKVVERVPKRKLLLQRVLIGWPITIAYAFHVPPYKEMRLLSLLHTDQRGQAKHLIAEALESMHEVPAIATYRMLQDLMNNIHLQQVLSTLEVPLLLMEGENVTAAAGAYSPIASFERIGAAVDKELVTELIIPGAGHLAMFVETEIAAEAILNFMDTLT